MVKEKLQKYESTIILTSKKIGQNILKVHPPMLRKPIAIASLDTFADTLINPLEVSTVIISEYSKSHMPIPN